MSVHHQHIRKRIHQKHEPFPHPDKWKRFMDRIIYVVSVIGPIMTIPQVLTIWIGQNASGVSVISWGTYLLCAIVWLFYGLMHREKILVFNYSVWIVLEILIVVGTLMYG